jgi:hypothetical protein
MQSRKDVEAALRTIKRWCRGKQILTDEQVKDFRARFGKCKTLEDVVALQKVLEHGHKLPHTGTKTMEEASAKVGNLIHAYGDTVGQASCGQDVNELIIVGHSMGKSMT